MIQIFFLLPLSVCCLLAKDKPKHKMALKDNLVAAWLFEHDPLTIPEVFDASHSGNNLRAVGYNVVGDYVVPGKVGNAVSTDGGTFFSLPSSGPVTTPGQPRRTGVSHQGGEFTVAFWFQPTELNQGAVLAVNNEWSISTPYNSPDFYFEIGIGVRLLPVPAVPLVVGEWYLVMFGQSEPEAALSHIWAGVWTTGQTAGVKSLEPMNGSNIGPFLIGGGSGPGLLDDFFIWRRALTDAERNEIWNDGDGLAFEEWDAVTPCREITCCD